MDKIQNNDTTIEGNSLSSTLSTSIIIKFKNAFETRGMLKFTPELEGELKKCVDETFEGIQFSKPSSPTEVVATVRPSLEPAAQATLRPLVFHFEYPGNQCVMAMMINGKPEVVKNEIGSKTTSAIAGITKDKRFVYGTDAKKCYHQSESEDPESWEYDSFLNDCHFWPTQCVDLKEDGLVELPRLFFIAYLIRKLKISAEQAQCDGSLCQVAILAVPMRLKSAQRLHLKNVAILAGFKDAYLISAEGLTAYYWFHEKEAEMEKNNYSKDFVIIDFFGQAVLYKRSFEAGIDGTEMMGVKAIIFLDQFSRTDLEEHDYQQMTKQKAELHRMKEHDKFREMVKETLKTVQDKILIPIIGRKEMCPSTLNLTSEYSIKAAIVKDDGFDEFKYFAAKAAALLSENPENIGHQVQNMLGTTIMTGTFDKVNLTLPDRILPKTSVRLTLNIKHDRTKYDIYQKVITRRSNGRGPGLNQNMLGYLVISGIKHGTELTVTSELNWEGIWKMVGVSAKYPLENGESNKEVEWYWRSDDRMGFSNFGVSSYEQCKSLLLKVAPSPSHADPTLPSPPSTSQAKVASAKVPEGGSTTGGSGNSLDQAKGLGSRTSTTSTTDQSGIEKKERSTIKSRVIRPNDIIVNTGLKKIKLESDWVEPVVKIEQDLMEDFGEVGNVNRQVNFEEQQEIEVEEAVVKIEVEEEEDIAN